MKFSQKILCFVALWCSVFCLPAEAREPDGRLGLIQTPNNGMPAIVTPGVSFNATLREKAALTLSKDGASYPLTTTWNTLPGELLEGQCEIPQDMPPGAYALRADTDNIQDTNIRAVYVFESLPQEYHIAHVTDVHIGKEKFPRKSIDIIGDVIHAVNASEATLALFTGDLTENGNRDQFEQLLPLLDACNMPTFVVAGNHDRQDHHYEDFFCKQTYYFLFGEDAYLGYDTKDYLIADEAGEQDGLLYYYRRQIRPARWSIGFTHRYDLTMGVRAQLTLFVDDPLDYLFYGHYHREAGEQDGIPWGKTKIIMTPAAITGQFRIVAVDSKGLHPQETIQAASVTDESPPPAPTDNKPSNPDQ